MSAHKKICLTHSLAMVLMIGLGYLLTLPLYLLDIQPKLDNINRTVRGTCVVHGQYIENTERLSEAKLISYLPAFNVSVVDYPSDQGTIRASAYYRFERSSSWMTSRDKDILFEEHPTNSTCDCYYYHLNQNEIIVAIRDGYEGLQFRRAMCLATALLFWGPALFFAFTLAMLSLAQIYEFILTALSLDKSGTHNDNVQFSLLMTDLDVDISCNAEYVDIESNIETKDGQDATIGGHIRKYFDLSNFYFVG